MSLMVRAMLPTIVVCMCVLVDGNQRIIYVSDEQSLSDHENFSLHDALLFLTNDVIINITTNVTFSSLVKISNLANVSIVGHNKPTVNCKDAGGIHFNFSHNFVIQDIIWDGCGTNTEPVIKFGDSFNISVKSCSFQHLKGQAIALSGVSGYVNINYNSFVFNQHYEDHGAAVHYLSSNTINNSQLSLAISNCSFTYNTGAKSLVYIESILQKPDNMIFQNFEFYLNDGVSLYVANQNVSLRGSFLFQNGENGTGIYIKDHSIVTVGKDSNVVFMKSIALTDGFIYITKHSSLIFGLNSVTSFIDNVAFPGVIYSKANSNVIFQEACQVTFNGNTAINDGAVVKCVDNCRITFKGNSSVSFINGRLQEYYSYYGGMLVLMNHAHVSFEQNSITLFSGNYGAAVRLFNGTSISLRGKSSTTFKNNTGGAIRCTNVNFLSFEENSNTEFIGNTAIGNTGGAISCFQQRHGHILFQGNSTTLFSNNVATHGGAIWEVSCDIVFNDNSSAKFINNTVVAAVGLLFDFTGGAISGSCISFKGNSTTEFTSNTALHGGAIYITQYITFTNISNSKFINNTAQFGGAIHMPNLPFTQISLTFEQNSSITYYNNMARANGGAIFSASYNSVYFRRYSHTEFIDNIAERHGGAWYSDNSYLYFDENSTTNFSHNIAEQGGAIYTESNDEIYFDGFSTIVFSNNIANEYGGAIANRFQSSIRFYGSSTVTFTDNNAPFGETVYCGSYSRVQTIGDSTITFNGVLAKWCTRMCLPYTGEGDLLVDGYGIVWCNQRAIERSRSYSFQCESFNCQCEYLNNLQDDLKNNSVVDIADKAILSTRLYIVSVTNVSIIGHNNLTVFCDYSSGLYIRNCRNCLIDGITWIGCGGDTPGLGILGFYTLPAVIIRISSVTISIKRCTFQYLRGPAFDLNNLVESEVIINECIFVDSNYSNYKDDGAAIYRSTSSAVVAINDCKFSYNHGTKSIIHLQYHDLDPLPKEYGRTYINNSSFYNSQGVCIYMSDSNVRISGETLFKNSVAENGVAIYIRENSTLLFSGENSNVQFINNSAGQNGSAIFMTNRSKLIFEQNSRTKFIANRGIFGTIYSANNSKITFKATSQVLFNGNLATRCGAAIYSYHNSHITFTESSKGIFINNIVTISERLTGLTSGGTVFSSTDSHITFDGNSTVAFDNNTANAGAAIFIFNKSGIAIKGGSKITFNRNVAQYCGILTLALFSNVTFANNTEVTFTDNMMLCTSHNNYRSSAGGICSLQRSNVVFSGQCFVNFNNNTAERGGAAVFSETNVYIEEHSTVTFNRNIAEDSNGGAFVCTNNSIVMITDNCNVTFNGNMATQSGGAIHLYNMCNIMLKENSTSSFIKNIARNNGGAILSIQPSEITVEGNSSLLFDDNMADDGGVFYFANSTITFKDASMVSFKSNKARQTGGVGYFNLKSQAIFEGITRANFDNNMAELNAGVIYCRNSKILFSGNSVLTLTHNKATSNGGALYFDDNSDVLFSQFTNITLNHNSALYGGAIAAGSQTNIIVSGNSVLILINNEALQSGGAGYFSLHCNVLIEEAAMATFDNNRALRGGALLFNNNTNFLLKGNSTTFFCKNLATVGGGSVNILSNSKFMLQDHIAVNFTDNSAQFGGAIFLDASAVMVNHSVVNNINFINNMARILGNTIHQDLCNNSCLPDGIAGINTDFIVTPPNEIQFYNPAVCIDSDNDTYCKSYYIVQDTMLGSDIVIPACVLDYYNHSIESSQFWIQSELNQTYFISGPNQVLIGCNTFEGISILGSQVVSKSTNISVTITLNTDYNPDWKQISVNLTVGLSQCHPGFWQFPDTQSCECYNANNIVFCSGSSSTIRRGYWFGSVTGRPTVTFCPINYCNFTCCETSNGYYHLSPVRNNQCRSHRSGVACGSCTDGYTLSFDSTACVNVDSCTAGQTVLVMVLTVTYWIVMVVLVFAVMYYRVGIGYIYSITYYYSIVDILLSQNLQASRGLYLTVNIMSSFSKITPQFLGELCLTTGMKAIDQQFIHYIHPSAVLLIIIFMSLLARKSPRFTAIISRGIIHVICLLLLLSYTSIASTSLLLMRSLTFHEIDAVYSYLSPDLQYFHGRHLAYGIVALLCLISVVIGLPLLLIFQPFLNHKFNFVRIKPLLDQFQGCYKDKYRCFAGYYMICRLVVITTVIANSSNEFVASYMLVIACGIIDLIHLTVRPYNSDILNKFDGIVLHLLIFITALPLLDDFDSPELITITYMLVILPLITFIALALYLLKNGFKKIATYFSNRMQVPDDNNNGGSFGEIPMQKFDHVIDSKARQNVPVTVCDIDCGAQTGFFREPVLDVVD